MSFKQFSCKKILTAASLVLAAVMVLGGANPSTAHKYYATLSLIDYNPRSSNFEIVHRFFVHDVEEVLSSKAGEEVFWDNPDKMEPMLKALLASEFSFVIDGLEKSEPEYIGFEVEGELMFIYQTVAYQGERPSGFSVASSMLMGFYDDQVNTVNLTWGSSRASETFVQDEGEKKLKFQ